MKTSVARLFVSLLGFTALTAAASAGEMEDRAVDKVIEAYGGDRFESLKSITIFSDLRFGWLGQGYTPDYVELLPMRKIYKIDLKNERGSEEAWAHSNGLYHERKILTEDGEINVDYATGTYTVDAAPRFYDHFGGEIRTSDTLLAYEILKRRDSVEHSGNENYLGRPHEKLSLLKEGSERPLTIYIDEASGYISKADNPTGVGLFTYTFSDHRRKSGITYAEELLIYVGKDIIEYAMDRSISINNVRDSTFKADRGMTLAGPSVDTSEMTVEQIAPGVHHVGQSYRYSTFIDAGDHLIGVGGTRGLKDRYDAYVAANGTKPLRYQIITHHHTDHLSGASDAAALGATLITPESAVAGIKTAAPDARLQILENGLTLGPVQINMISTNHASEVALVYIPAAKALFQADHYGSSLVDSVSYVAASGVALKREVDRLGLDAKFLLSAHHRKAEDWNAFSEAADAYNPDPCPTKRKICR